MDKSMQAGYAAKELYSKGQWLCSEAVLTVINDMLNRPLPREIVRLASGFPVGIGAAGCSCGALSGGVMALGLAFGRAEPGADNTKIMRLAQELHDWFKDQWGSTCCRVLVKDVEFGGAEHVDRCAAITGAVAQHVACLIEKETAYD